MCWVEPNLHAPHRQPFGLLQTHCYIHQNECSAQNCYYKQLKRKEKECEELKKQRQSDKGLITSTGKMNYQLIQEYDKLKTALAEIKEIAEKIDDSDGCAYGDYDCDNCSSLEQETVCKYKVKKLILQKIRECEAENEN